jgi:hypothetical protein
MGDGHDVYGGILDGSDRTKFAAEAFEYPFEGERRRAEKNDPGAARCHRMGRFDQLLCLRSGSGESPPGVCGKATRNGSGGL